MVPPDVLTKEQRRRSMRSNRGRTAPERRFAAALWKEGLRYYTYEGFKKVTNRRLPGSPDIIFPKIKVAVFVDGCFWHGCPKCKGIPASSGKFWEQKIIANRARDQKVNEALIQSGWKVIRIWEHDVDDKKSLRSVVRQIQRHAEASR